VISYKARDSRYNIYLRGNSAGGTVVVIGGRIDNTKTMMTMGHLVVLQDIGSRENTFAVFDGETVWMLDEFDGVTQANEIKMELSKLKTTQDIINYVKALNL